MGDAWAAWAGFLLCQWWHGDPGDCVTTKSKIVIEHMQKLTGMNIYSRPGRARWGRLRGPWGVKGRVWYNGDPGDCVTDKVKDRNIEHIQKLTGMNIYSRVETRTRARWHKTERQ